MYSKSQRPEISVSWFVLVREVTWRVKQCTFCTNTCKKSGRGQNNTYQLPSCNSWKESCRERKCTVLNYCWGDFFQQDTTSNLTFLSWPWLNHQPRPKISNMLWEGIASHLKLPLQIYTHNIIILSQFNLIQSLCFIYT